MTISQQLQIAVHKVSTMFKECIVDIEVKSMTIEFTLHNLETPKTMYRQVTYYYHNGNVMSGELYLAQ